MLDRTAVRSRQFETIFFAPSAPRLEKENHASGVAFHRFRKELVGDIPDRVIRGCKKLFGEMLAKRDFGDAAWTDATRDRLLCDPGSRHLKDDLPIGLRRDEVTP